MEPSAGQLELALLRARLHSFERQFHQALGARYVQLDEARAQAAKLRARFVSAANRPAIEAHNLARRTADAHAEVQARPPADPAEIKRLRLELARAFHPDLSPDEIRRKLRQELMTEANLALDEPDLPRLKILERALDRDEDGDATRELARLVQSPLNLLRERHEFLARRGQDMLQQLGKHLLALIEQAFTEGPRLLPPTSQATTLAERALEDLDLLSAVRELPFHEFRSMGEILVGPLRDPEAPSKSLGPARGVVRVPHGMSAILRLSASCIDLEQLRDFDPGDLRGLIDEWPDFVNLTDDDLLPMAHFTGLEVLRIGRTEITGRVFDPFASLRELRILNVEETGFDDAGLARIAESIWMRRLDLSFTPITDAGLVHLGNMSALRDLSLYGTNVGDEGLEVLRRIPGLRNLNLGLTGATDAIVPILERLRHLEVVNLGGTAVTDGILETLSTLPSLRELVLWETAVTEKVVDLVRYSFPALRYLDVDNTLVPPDSLKPLRPARPELRLPSDVWAEGV